MQTIRIRGARTHNLKNVDVKIPHNKLTVITGLSGSGKSSLAFDTIYAEGQRRYMESLSAYARQFLGNSEKPDVDSIEGLSPSISIDQKTTHNNPRSTVGTVTEIYDYLRLLYARIGTPYCPEHNEPIIGQTIKQMVDRIMEIEDRTRIMICAPVVMNKKGTHKDLLSSLQSEGYVRVRIDGEIKYIEEVELDKNKKHTILLVIDRIILRTSNEDRIVEALELANKYKLPVAIHSRDADMDTEHGESFFGQQLLKKAHKRGVCTSDIFRTRVWSKGLRLLYAWLRPCSGLGRGSYKEGRNGKRILLVGKGYKRGGLQLPGYIFVL
mgnify:CR=1 FL=1